MRSKFNKSILLITLSILIVSGVNAQIYSYTDNTGGVPAYTDPNTSGSNVDDKFGLGVAPSACPSGFNTKKYSTSPTWTITTTCVEFNITANTGYEMNIESLSADMRRTNNGPSQIRIGYSSDGGTTWNYDADFTPLTNGVCGSVGTHSWDFPDATVSGILVRIYGYAAVTLSGRLQQMNIVLNGTVSAIDNDGDGYDVFSDCDDDDAAVNPAAAEICNSIDDDCDGLEDGDDPSVTGVPTWYQDSDDDTYGNPSVFIVSCNMPGGGPVLNGDDCDDDDAAVNPAAVEICNSIDDNCDGNTDEGIDLTIEISPSGVITVCTGTTIELTATTGFDAYQWYKNGNAIPGATAETFTADNPGYYQIEGTQDECVSVSATQAIAVTPNPNDDIIASEGLDLCFDSSLKLKAASDPDYTWQWYLDGSPIGGATDNVYFAEATGDYYCVVTNSYGCTVTTETLTVINSCRIAQSTAFEISPNPVSDVFTLNMNIKSTDNTASVYLTSVTGQNIMIGSTEVVNGNINTEISLPSSIESGVYMLTVISGNETITNQIVITR
ncbi:MAG: T9SS type A sorting domain-containing protein [Fimbriimonadaceae bacterium]|nr:T9SS type A sorting domain-containing protein [Chitinophagales bacterium]